MSRSIIAVFGLLLIAMFGVAFLQFTLIEAGDDTENVNESFTPSVGINTLADSDLPHAYYDNETTVYNTTSGAIEAEEGTDYNWLEHNGTIEVLAGGELDGAASATITYSYQQTTKDQRDVAEVLAQFPRVLGLLAPFALVLVFLLLVK